MTTCFVIQPFDSGKFDKRFDDVYQPALEDAGLEAYRVDRDPEVDVPIESIEDGIHNAVICLADITTDNPNVWYELGYAFAAGRPVILVCSDERAGKGFPFDIQHRSIIQYSPESPSDFEELRVRIKERAEALLRKGETLRQIAESEQIATQEGLSQAELMILAIIAGDTVLPDSATGVHSLKHDAERAGLTSIGFGLGYRRLLRKGLVETVTLEGEFGEQYDGARLTQSGWDWVESNETLFSLKKTQKADDFDDDIPF